MKPRTPEWLVERLRRGDLPPDEAASVRERLAEEGGLSRLDALARDDAAFVDAHPPGPALGEIRRRAGLLAPRRPRRLAWVLVPVAAAAAALLVVRVAPLRPGGEDERMKGLTPHLVVHRAHAGAEPEALAGGARVRPGDLLQLSYVSGGRPYGVVLSVDGRGVVTRHGPGDGPLAPRLDPGGAVPLDHAYRLDDAPEFERFFLVTGEAPFAVEPVLDALRRLSAEGRARTDAPALPAGLTFSDFVVEKIP